MSDDLEAFLARCLHLSDEWMVARVEIDDRETKVDLHVSRNGSTAPSCPGCGCACLPRDTVKRTWRHTDLFDMECVIRCDVPCYRCPGCVRILRIDIPWEKPGSGFVLLSDDR